jgi:hypothetical protein
MQPEAGLKSLEHDDSPVPNPQVLLHAAMPKLREYTNTHIRLTLWVYDHYMCNRSRAREVQSHQVLLLSALNT